MQRWSYIIYYLKNQCSVFALPWGNAHANVLEVTLQTTIQC